MTESLRQEIIGMEADPDAFIAEFLSWKSMGDEGENNHFYFGRNTQYRKPLYEGRMVLWHVHYVPAESSPEYATWKEIWDNEWDRPRTSHSALAYAYDRTHGYLLIDMLWEPDAHEIAKMKTQAHQQIMHDLTDIAGEFIFSGKF